MKVSLKFPVVPPIGSKFSLDGQDYTLGRNEPHERVDGEVVDTLIWHSNCADCGAAFTIKTPLGFTTGQPRRCKDHRSPGKRVKTRKPRFGRSN